MYKFNVPTNCIIFLFDPPFSKFPAFADMASSKSSLGNRAAVRILDEIAPSIFKLLFSLENVCRIGVARWNKFMVALGKVFKAKFGNIAPMFPSAARLRFPDYHPLPLPCPLFPDSAFPTYEIFFPSSLSPFLAVISFFSIYLYLWAGGRRIFFK